jgi:flavorubredoxin
MRGPYEAVRITDRVWWVGAIDWKIREFHGYATYRGTTYNAYLIKSDKVTLVDTVKAPFVDEMLSRVASVVDLGDVDYILSNHSEMDHTGGLPKAVELMNPVKVYTSPKGAEALRAHFHQDFPIEQVHSGERRDFGGAKVTFLETRMLHWPDSMFAYLNDEKLLFSQDGFGMHLATSERFADEIPEDIRYREAAKYFANILMPFSPLVVKVLKTAAAEGITPEIIAPDHGPIFRQDPGWIVNLYTQWAARPPSRKAVVVFDTMWDSTANMARAVEEGLRLGGAAPVQVMSMGSNHRSDVATEILDAGALVVGSPTLNNNIFPTIVDVLTYLEGLRPRNLIGGAFGSYGWSGESVKRLEAWLERMKVTLPAPGVRSQYVPDEQVLAQCRAMGETIAAALVEQQSCGEQK